MDRAMRVAGEIESRNRAVWPRRANEEATGQRSASEIERAHDLTNALTKTNA